MTKMPIAEPDITLPDGKAKKGAKLFKAKSLSAIKIKSVSLVFRSCCCLPGLFLLGRLYVDLREAFRRDGGAIE